MKVEDIIKNPNESYLYLERYVNNGSPSGFSKNTTSDLTNPLNKSHSFKLPIVQFDKNILIKEIGENRFINLPKNTIFCHPDNLKSSLMQNLKDHWNIIDEISVSPTASGRTVKCLGDNSFFIKLDYYGMLGRINRNLDGIRILSAKEVSDELKLSISKIDDGETFRILTEDYGRYACLPQEDGSIYEMGFMLRDDIIYPHSNDFTSIIPCFSLFGKDVNFPEEPPILVQIFNRQKKYRDVNTFFEVLLKMIIKSYFGTLKTCGLCLEAHAQNMLIGINENYDIVCVIARDMESVDKDLTLRDKLCIERRIQSYPYKCLQNTDYNYEIKHSFMFDFKLGYYLIDPIIDCLSLISEFKIDKAVSFVKKIVNEEIIGLPKDYFPKQWFNYENKIFESNKKRPYIAHDNPRYR